jgi:hypothetical protein
MKANKALTRIEKRIVACLRGFEPPTFGSGVQRSTLPNHPHALAIVFQDGIIKHGAQIEGKPARAAQSSKILVSSKTTGLAASGQGWVRTSGFWAQGNWPLNIMAKTLGSML